MAPSRYDCKIVDWDVKPQHKQTNKQTCTLFLQDTSIGSEATGEQLINSISRVFLVSFKEKTPATLHLPEVAESLQEGW